MSDLIPYLVTGLVSGSLYGLAGLGLVLTYRTSGVFNFGHGAIAAASAFVFYSLWLDHGMPWPIAALITIVLFGIVVGALLDLVTSALSAAPEAVTVVATVGIMVGVQGILYLVYGNVTRYAPHFLPDSGFHLSGVKVSWAQVISFLVAAAGAGGLYLFLQKARLGVAMRGVVDNSRLLVLSGEDAARVRRLGWMIGTSAAAVSGILLAPLLNLDPQVLTFIVVQAFGACAIGYFSSMPRTFIGGLVVGLTAALITKYVTDPSLTGLPIATPFIILVVVLLVVPARKLPTSQRPLSALSSRVASPGRRARLGAVATIPLLVLLPFVVGTKLPVWTAGVTSVLVFASLAFLTWGSGQISLCHAAFLALGATSMAHLTDSGVPWPLAVIGAGLMVVPLGALVALPAIRLSGLYLALATLGLGLFLQSVIYQTSLMFGSALSVSVTRPSFGPFDTNDDRTLYFVTLGIVAVSVAALLAFQRGRFGRILASLAESPSMLTTNGLGINTTRLLVFCLSAFFAGVAGALTITLATATSAITFSPVLSLLLLAVLGIAGTRRLVSPVVAALLYSVMPGYVTEFGLNESMLAFGAAAVVGATFLAKRATIAEWVAAAAARSDRRRTHGPLARTPRASARAPAAVAGGPS